MSESSILAGPCPLRRALKRVAMGERGPEIGAELAGPCPLRRALKRHDRAADDQPAVEDSQDPARYGGH